MQGVRAHIRALRADEGRVLISRGYAVTYSTNGGGVDVRAKGEPRPAAEAVARDLKECNDQAGMGYSGRLQFAKCMNPRGYTVRSGD